MVVYIFVAMYIYALVCCFYFWLAVFFRVVVRRCLFLLLKSFLHCASAFEVNYELVGSIIYVPYSINNLKDYIDWNLRHNEADRRNLLVRIKYGPFIAHSPLKHQLMQNFVRAKFRKTLLNEILHVCITILFGPLKKFQTWNGTASEEHYYFFILLGEKGRSITSVYYKTLRTFWCKPSL